MADTLDDIFGEEEPGTGEGFEEEGSTEEPSGDIDPVLAGDLNLFGDEPSSGDDDDDEGDDSDDDDDEFGLSFKSSRNAPTAPALFPQAQQAPAAPQQAPASPSAEDQAKDLDNFVKELVQKSIPNVPQNYIEALQNSENPAQASQALGAIMHTALSSSTSGIMQRVQEMITSAQTNLQTQQQQQAQQAQQAQQLQSQIETDMSTRYKDIAAMAKNPNMSQYVQLAYQQAMQDPQVGALQNVSQFNDLALGKLRTILQPIFEMNGMKFTRANIRRLLKKQSAKPKQRSPRATSGTTNKRPKSPKAKDGSGFGDIDFNSM